jgi:transcription elongation factor GreB
VTIADVDDIHRTITIVGDDEADASNGRIGWNAPLSRALRGSRVGDVKTVNLPTGPKEWEVVRITYP